MALVNKPDESIFASSAKQGEVDNFPDLLRGWGITFDQTQGIPPMEWFNFLFKRLDEKHTYLMQRGLPEWSATQDYTKGSCVQFDGVSYRALKKSKNNNPNESNSQYWVRWGFALSEIAQATLTQYGITKLYTGYDSQSENLALTPKTAYQLKQLIDSNTRALGNVIPNSKKSSAVDSNSEDTVATSKSVKTAYDKGVEAKTAAENAHSAANNAQHTANEGISKANEANNNANGRVSKSGDTMTGLLSVPKIHLTENRTGESLQFGDDAWMGDVDMDNAVGVKGQQHPEQGYIAFGTAKKRFGYDGGKFLADAPLTVPDISSQGLWIERQHAFIRIKSSAHVSAAIDFTVQNGVHPHAAIETIDVGNYSTDIRFHTTPRGSDYNRDRRHHIVTFAPEGHIWAKPYGWLHDYFSKKADTYEKSRFATRFYSNHYNGAQVFDIPVGERSAMRIIEMNVTSGTYGEFNLPETLSGWAIPTANDVGEGKFPVGISMFDNNNKVKIWTRGNHVGIHVIVIGVVNW